MKLEKAILPFKVIESKEVNNDGTNIGVFSGHLAAFEKDRTGDIFVPGAFQDSIDRHKQRDRPIRMLLQHDSDYLIGGFPIGSVREDRKGLFVEGNINLDVQRGREAYALMKQGVLTDMSIGFSIHGEQGYELREGIRYIKSAEIWEGSLVTEPMNPEATVTEVKSAVPFQDLPLASRDRAWDADAAIGRVRNFTDSTDEPSATYRRAFLWFDSEDSENFGAYKLPIADVIDGKLTAVPRGIFAAAAAIQGARGGIDIPQDDKQAVINHLERYYAKMDLDSPFNEKGFYKIDDVKGMANRDIEKALRKTGVFSKDASTYIVSKIDFSEEAKYTLPEAEMLINLRKIKEKL